MDTHNDSLYLRKICEKIDILPYSGVMIRLFTVGIHAHARLPRRSGLDDRMPLAMQPGRFELIRQGES